MFSLNNGFKLTILQNGNIEKLEFERYNIEFKDQKYREYNNFDKNTNITTSTNAHGRGCVLHSAGVEPPAAAATEHGA